MLKVLCTHLCGHLQHQSGPLLMEIVQNVTKKFTFVINWQNVRANEEYLSYSLS